MKMVVASLGWGRQSFAMVAMSALGVLPKVDAAIHADTTHERSETYAFAKRWTPWLEERGVRVVTVKGKRTNVTRNFAMGIGPMIPAHTTYESGEKSGMLRRQCTSEWKLAPIRRWLQANRGNKFVAVWLGITLDEVQRMRQSDVQYVANVYPFVEMLDRPWTRGMATRWLLDNNLEVPVKSACVFCPYHNWRTWREIKMAGNGDWEKAVEVDEAIRHKRPGYVCYLTPERKPLVDCDYSSPEDHGQLSLWSDEECSGMCFL